MPTNARFFLAAVGATLLLTGCETTGMKLGNFEAKTPMTGSAAGSATSGESAEVEKCAGPLGTISLVENQDAGWYTVLRNEYRLPPTSNLLRLLVQQSNCFVVVERGAAGTKAMSREREIMQSGEMRGGSNFGKGQVVASDYGLSPEIVFSNSNASGMGGMLGALIGGRDGRAVANFTGNIQTKEASAMLTLVDNRSGVQVAAAEGSASKTDLNLFGGLSGNSGGAALGGYTNTAQGKVIAGAFMDAFNQMVRSLRNYKAQTVQGQGLGGGGRLNVDGAAPPSQTYVPVEKPAAASPKPRPKPRATPAKKTSP
jgi:curli biogenesis system outer membrane secretion channel CsgG